MKFFPIFLLTCFLTTFAQTTAARPPQTTASHPRWALRWSSAKGHHWTDQPDCHPLEYLTKDPKRFDYGQDLYGESPADIKDKVEQQHIGEIGGFSITQILHTIAVKDWKPLFIKMILVERRPASFARFITENPTTSWTPSNQPTLLMSIHSKVLAARDRISGNGNFYDEEYWTFDKQGPIPLNQDTIYQALKKLLSKGKEVLNGGGFDIEKLCYAMPVWQEGDGHCCPSAGVVQIKFALKNHQLVVVKQKYNPQPTQEEKDNSMACTL